MEVGNGGEKIRAEGLGLGLGDDWIILSGDHLVEVKGWDG